MPLYSPKPPSLSVSGIAQIRKGGSDGVEAPAFWPRDRSVARPRIRQRVVFVVVSRLSHSAQFVLFGPAGRSELARQRLDSLPLVLPKGPHALGCHTAILKSSLMMALRLQVNLCELPSAESGPLVHQSPYCLLRLAVILQDLGLQSFPSPSS